MTTDAPAIVIQSTDSILTVVAVISRGDGIDVGFGTNSEASVNFRASFPAGGKHCYFIELTYM